MRVVPTGSVRFSWYRGGAKRSPAQRRETKCFGNLIFDGKCYFSELPKLVVF